MLFMGFSSVSFSQFDTTFRVAINSIENSEAYSYYTLYEYDSIYSDDQVVLKYVFHERSDSLGLELGKKYKLALTKQSPCIFVNGRDTMNFCRSCRVVFADALLGFEEDKPWGRGDSIPIIGKFYKIEAVMD